LVALVIVGACASPPAHAGDFKFANRTITVPDGFEVELIAGPPLVDRPIAADFDEQGRLYVADSSGSNEAPTNQLKELPHRVLRFEDTQGNGHFDKSIVFADKMMIPAGAMWLDGSLFVGAPPSIWKLTDADGDGIADKREEWMQGKTLTGCANDIHGPYAGPDGWIYWCKGAFAKQTYERPGKPPFVTRAAHIFRARPDGTGIEPVMTGGMDNPVGVAFTPTGERILSCTFLQNPEAGRRDGLIHAIYGGVYGKIHDVIDEHPRTGDIMPVLAHLGPAAPCGLIRYASTVFGPEYQDNLFLCLFNLRKVTRHVLIPDGATFKTVDSDFMTSDDPNFHPTGVIEDADGSLIVINTGGWYKLCCPTSQLAKPDVLGDIYRIRRKGAPKIEDPRGLAIEWQSQTLVALAPLLGDPRVSVQKRAIHSLVAQGSKAVATLRAFLMLSSVPEARRNAVWAVTQIDSPWARQLARDVLADRDNAVRHVAAQSVSLWRDVAALTKLIELLHDEDWQIRRVAAEALGRIGDPRAVAPLLNAATQIDSTVAQLPLGQRVLEHSIIFALIEIAARDATSQGLANENPRVHRVALMALDQMPNGQLAANVVTPLLLSKSPVLKDTANWIVGRHPDWGGALAGFFEKQFKSPDVSESQATELQSQIEPFTGDAAIQELLARILADGNLAKPACLAILRTMAHAGVQDVPAAWGKDVAQVLRHSDPELVRDAVATARAFHISKSASPGLENALEQIGNDTHASPELRLEALAAAGPQENISSILFNFLLASIVPIQPWPIRNNATAVLSTAKLDTPQLTTLSQTLRTAGPAELPRLLNSFENCADESVGLALIDNLKAAKAISSLHPEIVAPRLKKFPDTVQKKAEELFAMLGADRAKEEAHLDQLLHQLPKGDIRRGQAIFNNPKVACSSCHAMGYRGGHVGPDLTSVGTIRTERDLLESIVYPSASFVRSFEPMVVMTKGGDDYTGVLRKDAADEVVLVTGPETQVRIARADIADMHQGAVSIMPQGLETQLSIQELADLVTFLKNTKWGAK
jgi:putative membrane-bound dehydrogenase-like protein